MPSANFIIDKRNRTDFGPLILFGADGVSPRSWRISAVDLPAFEPAPGPAPDGADLMPC